MLDTAAADLARDPSANPEVSADAHLAIAEAYGKIGDFRKAETHSRAALETLTRLYGPDHEETLRAIPPLVTSLSETDRAEEALALALDSQRRAERLLSRGQRLSAQLVGTVAHAMSFQPRPDWDQVVAWRRRSADLHIKAMGPEDRETLVELSNLGAELMESGNNDEALKILGGVIEVRTRTLGAEHPETLIAIMNLGAAQSRVSSIERSTATYEYVVEPCKRVLGPLHPSTLTAMRNLAICYFKSGRLEDAGNLSREVYEGRSKSLGPEHSETLGALGMYGNALMMLKRPLEAEPLVLQLYETSRRVFGDRHPHTLQAVTSMYDLSEGKGDLKGMRRWAEELRGTEYEQEVFRQLKIAEDAAAAKQ
jgi:tetratricopeptide (TPR) repeat protein